MGCLVSPFGLNYAEEIADAGYVVFLVHSMRQADGKIKRERGPTLVFGPGSWRRGRDEEAVEGSCGFKCK